jgi:hypothetical protein
MGRRTPGGRSAAIVVLCCLAVLSTPVAQLGWDAVAAALAGSVPIEGLGPLFRNLLPAATVTLVPAGLAAAMRERPSAATVTGLVFGASLILSTMVYWTNAT